MGSTKQRCFPNWLNINAGFWLWIWSRTSQVYSLDPTRPRTRTDPVLTQLRLVQLSVLRQLDELLGEDAPAVSQDVSLQLHVRTGPDELHDDGVAGGVDPDLHVLTANWGEPDRRREQNRPGNQHPGWTVIEFVASFSKSYNFWSKS